MAIAGTMSSREYNPPERSRTKHHHVKEDDAEKENAPETRTFGKKFKSAFRDAFKRNQRADDDCVALPKNDPF